MTLKPNGGIEYRFVERSGAPKIEDGKLSGRAAPFNKPTMIGKKPWGFRETIAPGAFSKSVNDGDVTLLDNHDRAKPIARQSAGTLKLAETKGGLDWDAVPANTTYANDVIENARAGNYGGCSFGFEVVRDSWHYNQDDDVDERTLQEVKLHEISVCTFPAYTDGTSVTARDQVEAALEARDRYYDRQYEALYVIDGSSAEDEDRGGNAPGNGKKPYGNVTYADPGYQKDGKKRYPIDSAAHAKAAWSYINKGTNASAYTPKQLASIKSRIKAACKKFGIKVAGAKGSKSGKNSAQTDSETRSSETPMKTDLRSQLIEILADKNSDGDARCLKALSALASEPTPATDENFEKAVRKAVKKALERSNTPVVAPVANNGVGTGGENDMDGDDPVCPGCNGSGLAADGIAKCEGGCAGTGRIAGSGDGKDAPASAASNGADQSQAPDKSIDEYVATGSQQTVAGTDKDAKDNDPKGIAKPFGLEPGAHADANVPMTGKHEADTSGLESRDGQPDTSTDPEDEDDATRYLRAIARKRRMQAESE